MANKIITIGRQFGSGGHEVGKLVAAQLGIKCYDRNLIQIAAEEGNIDIATMAAADERKLRGSNYSDLGESGAIDNMNRRLFELQSDVIRQLADRESCVIVGRCANYVLRDYANVWSVFICADLEDRITRIMNTRDLSSKDALALIKKTDKQRNLYYTYFTDKQWGEQDGYAITLNISMLGKDKCVDVLCNLVK